MQQECPPLGHAGAGDISIAAMRCFVALWQHGSPSRAADVMGLSVAQLGVHVMRIEDMLGGVLVRRHRHFIQLTPAGRDVARTLADALHLIEHARNRAVAADLAVARRQWVTQATAPVV
jgi:DNA-binding transcriptional LysR family regulator